MSAASPMAEDKRISAPLRILQKCFSFPVMQACLLIPLAWLTSRARVDDSDLWWHLKMGQVICATHTIPLVDTFSYTAGHHSLVPQEWLAEVAIFSAWKFAGLPGLMLWLCLFTSLLLIAGYIFCTLYSGNVKVAFFGAVLIWLFSTVAFSIRPQVIAYILLIVELTLIHLGRTRNPRWFFGLPLVFALWINCHGSFMLGLILAGVFLFTSFFSFQFGSLLSRAWNPQCRRMLIWSILLSLAALFANPGGWHQILYPFDTMLHMHILLGAVEEWAPLNMTVPRGMALLLVLLAIFLLVLVRRSELFFDELLLLAIGTWMAVSHQRMLIVFGILAVPVLSRQFAPSWDGYDAKKDRIWPNAMMIGICLITLYLAFPSRQFLESQVEVQSPVKAVQFIQSSHLSGPMLNDYSFGGYLIWAAPEHPVFIDGRTDLYEWSGILGEYGSWAMMQGDPRLLLEKYRIHFCLLDRRSTMAQVLPLLPGWKQVYADSQAVIFAR
ncbi:MAG: hypothetical protein WCA21_20945 [Terracidiphilus sp.]